MKNMICYTVMGLALIGFTGCAGINNQEAAPTTGDANSTMKCQAGKCGNAKEMASKADKNIEAETNKAKETAEEAVKNPKK